MITPPSSTPTSQPPPFPHEFVIAEFQYIADSTNQSSEDRARVSNYYLVTIGGALAAILGGKLDQTAFPAINLAIGFGCVVLASLGWFTLFTLIRLRVGWLDGAKAMNKIKDYYATLYPGIDFKQIFAWNSTHMPDPGKLDSVAFWTAISIIVIDSAVAALGLMYGIVGIINQTLPWWALLMAGVGALVSFGIQLRIYWQQLPRQDSVGITSAQSVP